MARRKGELTLVNGVLVDADQEKISLIYAAVDLERQGLSQYAIGAALGVSHDRVNRALRDPRADVLRQRMEVDQASAGGSEDVIQRARTAYRVARAWETLEGELDNPNPWLAHQAALAIIAASTKQASAGGSGTELVVSPGLAFDDQNMDNLQSSGTDDSDPPVLIPDDADQST